MYKEIALNEITDRVQVRKINLKGVEVLKTQIEQNGYNYSKPIRVVAIAGGYLLIDGNHRVEACNELGMGTIPAIVDSLENEFDQLKQARLDNYDTEAVIPTTFVDDAELVWALSDKHTQETIGGIMGWSRGKVNHYVRLAEIDTQVWGIVSTNTNDLVSLIDTTVSIFNEGLLRQILDLTPSQQLELVTNLANNNINKKQFKKQAQTFKERNELKKQASTALTHCGQDYIDIAHAEIDKGNTRIIPLIQSLIDQWEEKEGFVMIHGEFTQEAYQIDNNTIHLVLTDPPYNISGQGKVTKKGSKIVNADFGAWDVDSEEGFLLLMGEWLQVYYDKLVNTGNMILFSDRKMIGDIIKVAEGLGFVFKQIIVWEKSNPQPSGLSRNNLISATEFLVWFAKGNDYTFNKSQLWDRRNIITTSLCAGHERLTDTKGETLHPTQKPLDLLLPLVEVFSNYGNIVMDGFAGTGSTGVASKQLGRKFVGIEQDNGYYNAMTNRMGG